MEQSEKKAPTSSSLKKFRYIKIESLHWRYIFRHFEDDTYELLAYQSKQRVSKNKNWIVGDEINFRNKQFTIYGEHMETISELLERWRMSVQKCGQEVIGYKITEIPEEEVFEILI